MKPIIEIKDIWFDYQPGERDEEDGVLKGINLQFYQGEYVALIGPNGSGKSTLARMINGLFIPTKGIITVHGISTSQEESIWEIRKHVGLVFQNPDNQIVATTVEDDVAFGLENIGVPREEMRKIINQSLERVGLHHLKHREPYHLSGGQKQRLAIAGILAMNPDVILFDEATSMLDPVGQIEVIKMMEELHRVGKTVIHITHSAKEAFLAERIIVIAHGKVQLDLPSRELYVQAGVLENWGLESPIEIKLLQELHKKGWDLEAQKIYSMGDLVREICKSLQKN